MSGDVNEELGYEVFMRPLYARAIADLLILYDTREMFYIYSSNEGFILRCILPINI